MKNEIEIQMKGLVAVPLMGFAVGGLVAAAGVLGEIACPSDQGKEKSKEVVVLGGRIVGASSAMLIMASVASLAF